MNNIFLIFGYGVPKNILKDKNYNFYLNVIFNRIYDITRKENIKNPIIITCGGPTDLIKPYKKTESQEMLKWFDFKIKSKSFLKSITKNWIFLKENKSLSTLENLLNSKYIISKRKINKANIFVFCEMTRQRRIKILAKKVFVRKYKVRIIPIDFDMSINRYISLKDIAKIERLGIKYALWALQSKNNFKRFHKIFEEKLEYLRSNKNHIINTEKWFDEKLGDLEK